MPVTVEELYERTRTGSGGVLVVDALDDAARLARTRDMTVRRAKGRPEPLATVGELLNVRHPLRDEDAARSAVLTLVMGLARHQPVALLVDTARADEPSLRILAAVAERTADLPVALVTTAALPTEYIPPPAPPPPPG